MNALLIRSERVALPDAVRPASIHVVDGRIVSVRPYAERSAGVREIDAGSLVVIPGLVDTHVHINEPGRAEWEGFEAATRAAVAGGVTTLVDMPLNSVPPTTSIEGFRAKEAAAAGKCFADVAFWGGVVPGNSAELEPLALAGARGFKCFMSPSGVEEFEHVGERDLRDAMPILATLRLPLLVHAELPARLNVPAHGDVRSYETWLRSRPPEAEQEAIETLIRLSREFGVRVHVVHLASAAAAPLLRRARAEGLPVTSETCPHYLAFAAEEIPDGATAFKCAPPIRERAHREGLWQALLDGDVDLIATDHSPAPPSMKCVEDGDFMRAWGGIASLQLGLAATWVEAAKRGIDFHRVVTWMSAAPARLAGLEQMKGSIAVGMDADLAIWDPDVASIVEPAALYHRHPLTPYTGMTLRGAVRTTFLRGEIVFHDGAVRPNARGKVIGSRP